jgi:hypothetical protein
MTKQQAAATAEKAKEAGAPGREAASAAEAGLPGLKDELARLQAARMKPEDLTALREEVKRRAGEAGFNATPSGPQESAAGYARRRLQGAEDAEQAYSAAQQEYEQFLADIDRFKTGTAALAKAAEEAMREFNKAVETARATNQQIARDEAVHRVNIDAAGVIGQIKAGQVIQAANVPDNALSRSVVSDIQAMGGVAQGQQMDAKQTEMINHLVAGLRAQGASQQTINGLLREMRDLHTDEATKLQDIWAAFKQIRAQVKNQGSP